MLILSGRIDLILNLFQTVSYGLFHRQVEMRKLIDEDKANDVNKWNGYSQNKESVRYVERIHTYYDIFKREAIS